MSTAVLTPDEIQFLREAINSNYKMSSIRLREGEHQYSLAKAIASFQLELTFPDVKDIIVRLYGEGRASDVQLVRKVQTILKKMEKSGIVKILPKKRPWELQKYAVSSFKFQDVDRNMTALATEEQIKQAQTRLDSANELHGSPNKTSDIKLAGYLFGLVLAVVASYIAIVWDVMQPAISPIVFVASFSIAMASSVALGRILSRNNFRSMLPWGSSDENQ